MGRPPAVATIPKPSIDFLRAYQSVGSPGWTIAGVRLSSRLVVRREVDDPPPGIALEGTLERRRDRPDVGVLVEPREGRHHRALQALVPLGVEAAAAGGEGDVMAALPSRSSAIVKACPLSACAEVLMFCSSSQP